MKKEYENELSPEIRDKMKKNLIYVVIFSIVMLFAGFTSAYIVSMGDSFWLKYPLPQPFYVSTVMIALSSIFFIIGISRAKKGDFKQLKIWVALTLLAGLSFVYFQFQGYGRLVDSGINPLTNHILVVDGRYGDFYQIRQQDDFIEVDGNRFLRKGKLMDAASQDQMQQFARQFTKIKDSILPEIKNYGKPFVIYYKDEPLSYLNGKLRKVNGESLTYVDLNRLHSFSWHVMEGRGDFFVKGEMNKDFFLYYKGNALTYKNRDLYYKNKPLPKYLYSKAMDASDTATTFLYVLTVLHLLHVIVTLFFMIRTSIRSLTNKYNPSNVIDLQVGGIFWHFLGLLWLYLLLFLLFIH